MLSGQKWHLGRLTQTKRADAGRIRKEEKAEKTETPKIKMGKEGANYKFS